MENLFLLRGKLKKVQKQAEMKGRKLRLSYIYCVLFADFGSVLGFFHPCLVFVLFRPIPNELKFYKTFFPTFLKEFYILVALMSLIALCL